MIALTLIGSRGDIRGRCYSFWLNGWLFLKYSPVTCSLSAISDYRLERLRNYDFMFKARVN